MGVNSLPKTVTRQRRDCDLNPGRTAPESSTLTTRLPSHPTVDYKTYYKTIHGLLLRHYPSQRYVRSVAYPRRHLANGSKAKRRS